MSKLTHLILQKPDVVGLFAICLLIMLCHAFASPLLRYELEALQTGQLWRALTGHFVHLGWTHTLLNMAGLLMLAYGFDRHSSVKARMFFIIASSCFISLGLFLFFPQVHWYVGLSGVLHGYIMLVAWENRQYLGWQAWLLALAVSLKVLYEQFEPAMSTDSAELIGGRVVVEAHLLGWLSGLFYCFIHLGLNFLKNKQSQSYT